MKCPINQRALKVIKDHFYVQEYMFSLFINIAEIFNVHYEDTFFTK